MATLLAAVPLLAASCGGSGGAGATLPPIITTTSTSVLLVTTTIVVSYYIVKSGDTLGNIARRLGVDMNDLMVLNSIPNANDIEAGQSLLVPPPRVVIDSLPTP